MSTETAPSNALLGRRKLLEAKLIKIYKGHRCLWDKGHPEYSNKVSRDKAWSKLTKFHQVNLDPLGNVVEVKKKLDNLRTAFKREWKRVQSDPSYHPSLWYYNLLTFLACDADYDSDISFVDHKSEIQSIRCDLRRGDLLRRGKMESKSKRSRTSCKKEEPSPKEVDVITRLLDAWKSKTCLWKKDDVFYQNKDSRLTALEDMLPIYQELKPKADIQALKNKLTNMRDVYTRIRRGFDKSTCTGIKEPSLWYYDLIDFLRGETLPREGTDELDDHGENELNDGSSSKQQDLVQEKRKKGILSEFIELYKENRCLWDKTYPKFLKHDESGAALQLLLQFYRSNISRNATMNRVKKKIENLRLAWRRAQKEAVKKKKEGLKQWKPQLWYFDQLAFIDKGNSNETTDDEETSEDENSGADYDSSLDLQEKGLVQDDEGSPDQHTEIVVECGEMNEVCLAFIDLFKQQRCLWDPRHSTFYVRREKDEAYSTLLQFYRSSINPSANTTTVKKKVAQLKATWKAEADKVKASEETTTDPSEVYRPSMTFYDALSFLTEVDDCEVSLIESQDGCGETVVVVTSDGEDDGTQGIRKSSRLKDKKKILKLCYCDTTLHHEGDCGLLDKDPMVDDDDDEPEGSTRIVKSQPGMRTRDVSQSPSAKRMKYDLTDIRRIALEALEKVTETPQEGTWVTAGRSMGLRLGLLSSEQRAIALKLMNDALFYGELGKLNEHWAVLPPKTAVRSTSQPSDLRSSNVVSKR